MMTRQMADAISANYGALPAGVMRAGYVTGSAGIVWTPAQLATAAVTIDQGYTGSPVPNATVRDVELGAWTAASAVNSGNWTAARPTIYISQGALPSLVSAGWHGDVWLAAWTGTPPAAPPVMPAGMTCVAVQYTDQGAGGAYDLSVVFDDSWPVEVPVIPGKPGDWALVIGTWSNPDGSLVWLGVSAADGYAYIMTAPLGGTWGTPVKVAT